ncbi:MAG TPA: stage 0 sporulation family protein, partial [Geobacterales bacterium]|nr:stage 0 sporulation family protein [Geobacterales bacterium]
MTRIVKIQFQTAGKLYDFSCGELELKPGDLVIVETERGRSIGKVMHPPEEVPADQLPEGIKPIQRLADAGDVESASRNAIREQEAHSFCLRKIKERNMQMKLVKVEYLYDGSKAIFYFTADGRVDFRELVKDLAHQFHTRIEMRQIGVRDESKMVGGIGICGRELCCASFLRDFAPVSVKMAKEQNLALNPTKISGQCGRLLCCLGYEFETYCALRKCLPKCGKVVKHGGVEGEVVKLNILDGSVTLRTDERLVIVRGDEIQPSEISDKVKKPATKEGPPPREQRSREGRPSHQRPQGDRQRNQGQDSSQRPAPQETPPAPPTPTTTEVAPQPG